MLKYRVVLYQKHSVA